MSKINILDNETCNKIAAGEVVERPFSVVKELVENSIDASSKNILVEIEEGGEQKIKVTDNGIGIEPEDIKKAFLPHATSKIKNIDDIFNINTMGFRGEALSSIAAVSKTLLKSRVAHLPSGKEILLLSGNIEHINDTACNVGTVIEIKDLFYNVPARKKFLKSSRGETSAISDIINRLSLANPDIAFKLISNGRNSVTTYGTGNLTDAIRSIYGKTISNNIINFEKHTDIASVYGYIGNREISRGSRNNQSVFVNKRYVKNKLITAAVENAFKSFLTINKYPFFILFIDIFPEYVDVNVHPTKTEIKFINDRQIFKMVFDTVHEAIRNTIKSSFDITSDKHAITNNTIYESKPSVQLPMDLKTDTSLSNSSQTIINNIKENIYSSESNINTVHSNNCADFIKEDLSKTNENVSYSLESNTDKINNKTPECINSHATASKDLKNESYDKIPKFPELNIIGQLNNTYILSQGPEGLYIIDQHAAHEKILFEKYRKNIKNREVISQILISPVVVELNSDDFHSYYENKDIFLKTGFNIEDFGDNTISIRETPFLMGKNFVIDLFMDILDNLKNMGTGETTEVKFDSIAKLACKSAVKANDRLSNLEMNSLINELRFIDDPFTCPHGRPTIIKITLNELEKKFKRIQ